MRRILITTGDPDGIGLEVATKALAKIGPTGRTQFLLWKSSDAPRTKTLARLCPVDVPDLDSALKIKREPLVQILSTQPPARWVEQSAFHCLSTPGSTLVTGPISKGLIRGSGMDDLGHTGILKRVCHLQHAFMFFIGRRFSVLLATDHIPLRDVPQKLNIETLTAAVLAAEAARRIFKLAGPRRPLGLLGLNPHAGEGGLIGAEELMVHGEVLKWGDRQGLRMAGPLVPDVAFSHPEKYSVYIANHHDQGLIPFKLVHGRRGGAHVTLGPPFLRTSVDHGCAKDIFGKGVANPASMVAAIRLAIKFGDQYENESRHFSRV